MQALWNYIKSEGLQDKLDRRTIKTDAKLHQVRMGNFTRIRALILYYILQLFGTPNFLFNQIPELVRRYLLAPDPIILHYTLNPQHAPPEKPSAWDVEVKVDDVVQRNRMNGLVIGVAQETAKELVRIDEEVRPLLKLWFFTHLTYTICRIGRSPNTIPVQFPPEV